MPRISRIFAMLLPRILPIAISVVPLNDAITLTTNSGIDVPNATIVRPIISVETLNLFASEDEPSTKKSAPLISRINPTNTEIYSIMTNYYELIMKKVGIIALQGDVSEHVSAVERAIKNLRMDGCAVEIRERNQIQDIDALIIPGGESTTIGRLISKNNLGAEIKKLAKRGIPIMGTCAGLVLLAKKGGDEAKKLGLMNIEVERNAFGRQRESFEADIKISCIPDENYHAIFIRAPAIKRVWGNVKILAKFEDRIVMAQEKNLLAIAFHPELSNDSGIHEYFLGLMKD